MIRIAVLGTGHIARKMAHTLRRMREAGEDVCLYAAASRDLARAKAFCEEEGFEKAFGSYEEMAADPAVDLVYVATPHSHHAEHMKLCLENGRAVLCEKAFTGNAAQAREVLALAREKRVLCAEAMWTRYMPFRRLVRDLLDSGAIGEPQVITASLHYPIESRRRIREKELAGGALLDLGVYPLNFAAMFFGTDIERMQSGAQLLDTGVDRQENFSLYYADGRAAHITSGVNCRSDTACSIGGTRGYILVDTPVNPQRVTLHLEEDNYAAREIPLPDQLTGYEYEVRACMRALERGEIECSEMPHSETLRIMEIMDALRREWGVTYPFD